MLYIRKVDTKKLEDVWMKVALIASPYDLGREGVGMGEGPARYLQAGAADSLSERGFEVEVGVVERQGAFEDELSATAEVNAGLARRVREAAREGAFPLVLGGNCDSSLGFLSGLGPAETGIVWFDAHGDFLAALKSQVGKVYLHLDIDSLDPRHAPGVDFPAHGGLSPEEVEEAINLICETFEVSAASLTAFNPEKDEEDMTLRLGMRLMETIVGAVCRSTEKRV